MAPRVDPEVGCIIPEEGQWPVDPQKDVDIAEDRLWIDGCFDFFHHGHAGVMLQSRRLGSSLIVGLHSDADIAANKGPTVMNLAERVAAVDACRFSTAVIPHAPYVTSLPWISHYGCKYVTHGDDITSDASGEDCYRFVKKAGRMKIVPRTPEISTTDLVGRMLGCTKEHFIPSLTARLEGKDGNGSEEQHKQKVEDMRRRIKDYAAAPNGKDEFVAVYTYGPGAARSNGSHATASSEQGTFTSIVPGYDPRPDQRVIYIPGAFDLFNPGHIAFLQSVTHLEEKLARDRGWYTPEAQQNRISTSRKDYSPAYVVIGLYDDSVVNRHKGINYPIMNIFERGLCVMQCKYVHAVVFGAPDNTNPEFLGSLPACKANEAELPSAIYNSNARNPGSKGHDAFADARNPGSKGHDAFVDARALGLYVEIQEHDFQDVNAAQIVSRILEKRSEYEERQRKKGVKSVGEGAIRRLEMEKELAARGG
ncbi:hypothetical protein LTR62_007335 [Meristemomyces frigidus]|uniref:ethanolamine-phosphate cytidylyltransferase n=1 Tax=Meristemomyces frigidus TaxID=1508187 RepID=A0AAN7YRI0_9PEZI|nr:hypothetical protein LTR62_007335 [Meristemomyces frigidus]